ncbi:hypothetical protein GCM10010339_93780 [Streptomyces alanosinicus]|uniref:Uncharacterized protein n=1 Tax=Streptomyces alanosinicus TaxID=68171 RepID=A0A918MGS5_9ACTN|nr:hypothetical protein GCM10010339_93780 [Streptomyces alanosinicus]
MPGPHRDRLSQALGRTVQRGLHSDARSRTPTYFRPMANFFPPTAARPLSRSETRLALVMNGGVSLAVWMGGVTHELDLLCRAFADAPETPFADDRDAAVFGVWKELAATVDTRVVVDIIAAPPPAESTAWFSPPLWAVRRSCPTYELCGTGLPR